MAPIAISVTSKVKKYLVGPTHCARSLFCFNQFIGDVGNAKAELESKLAQVKERQEEVARKNEEITPPVKKWLDNVEALLQEVHKLQQEVEAGGKKCFNISLRYSLEKKMENMAEQMRELEKKSNFEPFSHPIQLPAITPFTFKKFVDFHSRKSTYNHLLEAIKDGKNKMVGLYGTWGSGKTTLAKEMDKKVAEQKLFDKVVVLDVPKPQNVKNIQQEIAEQIGLEFREEAQISIAAERLRTELKSKKILIILDDVTSNLSLKDIGIPHNEGCCILLTTRLPSVCDSMGCNHKIELPHLTKEEAWTLLKMHANINNDSSNEFDGVGRQIVDECKGLPMAIVTVGSTLKGKRFEGWVAALWRLQHSQPFDVEKDLRIPYACITFNYDNLPSPTAKSLFLLCSIFPVDCRIKKEDLIRFGKGMLKLDESVDTMEDARREISLTINKLIDSRLLIPTYKQGYVKMHHVVRHVALLIAKKRHKANLVESHEVSKILERNESVKCMKAISLWNLEESFKVSNQLSCPTLEFLLLHPEKYIDDFGGIKALRVLALIQFSFIWSTFQQKSAQWSISQSIVSLTNLHTLCLRGIALGSISFLSKLKGLEILDLRGSSFYELPIGIEDLKKLKLLDLFGCSIEKSPYGVIQKCVQLQELYLWDKTSTIPENLSISKLERYVICDSKCDFSMLEPSLLKYFDGCVEASRALGIQDCNVSNQSLSVKDLIFSANIFWVNDCTWDIKDIINSEIKHLVVSRCPKKMVIVDNLDVNILIIEQLITLRLSEMNGLEQVFQDSSISCSLQKLQELYIEDCPQLHDICFPNSSMLSCLKTIKFDTCPMLKLPIFSPSIAQSLVLLEKLYIRGCNHLRHITAESEEEGNAADGSSNPWTSSMAFQNLRTLDVDSCAELESILPLNFARSLLKLDSLDVRSTPKLKYVIGGRKDDWVLVRQRQENKDSMEIDVNAPSLTKLSFRDLPEAISLYPQPFDPSATGNEKDKVWVVTLDLNQLQNRVLAQGFLNLTCLSIERCKRNKGIFELQVRGAVDGVPVVTQKDLKLNSELHELYFDDLPELEFIWKGPKQILSLHRLERVLLLNLRKLRTIFTIAIVPSLPELRKLDVRGCNEWEGIICEDSLKNLSTFPPNVCFPKLLEIHIQDCKKVKWMFPCSLARHCPSLEKLHIQNCRKLEGVVEGEADEEATLTYGGYWFLLPKLNTLHLDILPKLRQIFEFKEPLHHIQDCPKKNESDGGELVVNSDLSDLYLEYLPELEYIWRGPTPIVSLHRLEGVSLSYCSKVRAIFTGAIVPGLPELRQLDVKYCHEWEGISSNDSVKNLSASSPNVCFPKLSKITISYCKKVKWIFPYDLACHCPSLEILRISECVELEGVVEGFEGEGTGDYHLLLPKLKILELGYLPKLRQIFPGIEYYKDQPLRHTQDYPNRNENDGGAWMVNSELCYLHLHNVAELEYIWGGLAPTVSLHRLEKVELYECTKVRTIFTGVIIPSLPELRELEVGYCDEWEGIMCEDSLKHLSASSPNVCFPKLLVISIGFCSKVKRVFSYSLASHCPSLQKLRITECSELEEVVEGEEKVFPKLKALILSDLPKLKQIYASYKNIQGLRISHCPNIH